LTLPPFLSSFYPIPFSKSFSCQFHANLPLIEIFYNENFKDYLANKKVERHTVVGWSTVVYVVFRRFPENSNQFELLCKKNCQSVDVWGCLSSSKIVLKKWIIFTRIIIRQSSSYQMINVGLAIFTLTDPNSLQKAKIVID
jgi:hypothetical protein